MSKLTQYTQINERSTENIDELAVGSFVRAAIINQCNQTATECGRKPDAAQSSD